MCFGRFLRVRGLAGICLGVLDFLVLSLVSIYPTVQVLVFPQPWWSYTFVLYSRGGFLYRASLSPRCSYGLFLRCVAWAVLVIPDLSIVISVFQISESSCKYFRLANQLVMNGDTFYVHHTLLGQEQATSLLPKGKSRLRWTMTLEYNILQHAQDTSESPLVSARRPNHQ